MGQILIRKLDDAVLDALRARAKANNRSVEAEARAIIGAAVPVAGATRLSLRDFVGLHPTGRNLAEIVGEVRALRDEWPA